MDIRDTITQLTAERDRIDKAIDALQAIDGPPAPAAQRSNREPARPRRPRRTTAEVLSQDTVLKLITPEGVPARTLRSRLRATDTQVLRSLKSLESAGKVKRSGQRRSTRWHSVA
jgi:predicted Rossmann fold nucleotide-binding protein DprA/Smf involved in DNA uptake